MQQKIYTCECGKTFTEPNKFNGHKSNCEVHRTLKGTWELRTIHAHYAGQKSKEAAEKRAQAKLEQWISEQHTCEKCGKMFPIYFDTSSHIRNCPACTNSVKETKSEEKESSDKVDFATRL
jgi:ribosomal protein L37AE/L43A